MHGSEPPSVGEESFPETLREETRRLKSSDAVSKLDAAALETLKGLGFIKRNHSVYGDRAEGKYNLSWWEEESHYTVDFVYRVGKRSAKAEKEGDLPSWLTQAQHIALTALRRRGFRVEEVQLGVGKSRAMDAILAQDAETGLSAWLFVTHIAISSGNY